METRKDYYKILGVERTADKQEITKAYKKLALKWHPDKNREPQAEERFKEIGEAISVLGDNAKRREYDLTDKDFIASSASKPSAARKTPVTQTNTNDNNAGQLKKTRYRHGDEQAYFVVLNYLSLPSELFAEGSEILKTHSKPTKKSFMDFDSANLQSNIFYTLLEIPSLLSVFSSEADAVRFKSSAHNTFLGMNTIQCFGIVKLQLSPRDLLPSKTVYSVHTSHSDNVDVKQFGFQNPVYQMSEEGYLNLDPDEDVDSIMLYSEFHAVPLFEIQRRTVLQPANLLETQKTFYLNLDPFKTTNEANIIEHYKFKTNHYLQQSDANPANKLVKRGTTLYSFAKGIGLKAIDNMDYIEQLRDSVADDVHYQNLNELINAIKPIIDKIIPVGTKTLTNHLHSMLQEMDKVPVRQHQNKQWMNG